MIFKHISVQTFLKSRELTVQSDIKNQVPKSKDIISNGTNPKFYKR